MIWSPGQWTDDTSMALCLAASLIETGHFDPEDQMQRYVRWWEEGFMSSTGTCFDIGNTRHSRTLSGISQISGDPYAGSTDPFSAGNGSLTAVIPCPHVLRRQCSGSCYAKSADSSRTTHGAREAVDACRYFGGLLIAALNGVDKETILSSLFSPLQGLWERSPLAEKVAEVATGSFKHREPPEIRGTGYVAESMLGGALGIPQEPSELPRRCPSCRQPRRRRRHHCCNLLDRSWGPLWSRGNSI